MGRDSWSYARNEREREAKKRMNPVWRGVGCLMLVGLALAGYFFANWFLVANLENGWVFIPNEAMNPAFVPAWLFPYLAQGVLVKIVTGGGVLLLGYWVFRGGHRLPLPL